MSFLNEKNVVHINIGQVHACKPGPILKTLLGSCVSACLFDPIAKVAGMNHILLSSKADMKKFDVNARYGIHAMELLITGMQKLGAHRDRLQAKAFGGGNVLESITAENSPGRKNVEFIKEFLSMEEIPLIAEDFGGHWTRVLHFHTSNFHVFVKKSKDGKVKKLKQEENKFKKEIITWGQSDDDVVLFDD